MKKIIALDIVSLLLSGIAWLVSKVANVTAFTYPFSTGSLINLVFIFRIICFILFAVFAVLLVYIIVSKIRKVDINGKASKTVLRSSLAVILIGSVLTAVIVSVNYKPYGDGIISAMKGDSSITCMQNTDVDASGKRLFGTRTVSIKIHDWNNSATLFDYVYSDTDSVIEQFLMQYRTAQGVYLDDLYEQTEYKGLTVYRHHTSDDLSSIGLDSINETNYYLVKGDNDCLYMERSAETSRGDTLDEEAELENLYLIYTSLTNDKQN